MITHSDINDQFAFELNKDMFINPLVAPDGCARAHLMAYILAAHISKRKANCKMKKIYVDKLVDFITDTVLK
jgi:hypothetical protein